MNKEIITLAEVEKTLHDLGASQLILWAIPVFFILITLEFILSMHHNRKVYDGKDFLASIGIGLGNLLVNGISKAMLFGLILFVYNVVPWSVPFTWWSFILCQIWLDFWHYWAHRLGHENRFWWATHVVHHSSEQYNFSVSFRLSWIQQLKIIFYVPIALAGFHPVVFFICYQIEVLYQFWLHTEFIKKLPTPIEYVLVTPSHHRVHHGRNEKYLDKNYGSTFIFWDRIFGTFQAEEEAPEYGITTPPNSFNPAYLVLHEAIDIVKDIYHSESFSEAWQRTFVRPSKKDALEARLAAKRSLKKQAREQVTEVVSSEK